MANEMLDYQVRKENIHMFGIRTSALLIPILVVIGFVLWLIAVKKIKNNDIDNISKVLWAAFVTWSPIAGPICYFVINPKKEIS